MNTQYIPVISRLVTAIQQKREERQKQSLRKQGLSPLRTEERPFKEWGDRRLKLTQHDLTMRIRAADGGFGLSPVIDRSWLMSEEMRERGIETLDSGQLEQIEYWLERIENHG